MIEAVNQGNIRKVRITRVIEMEAPFPADLMMGGGNADYLAQRARS